MAKIARLIGGAGTGKTTELLRVMGETLASGVPDPMKIGFVSFTRAARQEAAQRAAAAFGLAASDLERDGWFRTLHSVCYRCLDVDAASLLTGSRESTEWLADAMKTRVRAPDTLGEEDAFSDDSGAATPTDRALTIWSVARNRCESLEAAYRRAQRLDPQGTPPLAAVKSICRRYETAKTLDGRLDFVDLLARFAGYRFDPEHGVRQITPEGWTPDIPVWFFDEQQDASALLDAVCHRIIATPCVKWVYVVGDPYQAVYGWAGADAAYFRAWPAEKERIMPKSYRCPSPILALGEAVLKPCSDYFDRGIAPADHDGSIDQIESPAEIVRQLDPRDDWLLVARTNRQAKQFADLLDERGIPWVPTRGNGGWKAPKRSMALLGLWTLETDGPIDGVIWSEIIKQLPSKDESGVELLTRGTKTRFASREEQRAFEWVTLRDLPHLGGTPHLQAWIASGRWRTMNPTFDVFAAAVDRYGPDCAAEPSVRVGTIHSVKGMEAENVALLTTLTQQISRAKSIDPAVRDEERRVQYVGVTRARRRLCLVGDPGSSAERMRFPR